MGKFLPWAVHGAASTVGANAGKLTAAGAPLYFLARFSYRYANSPVLRKYYNQMLRGAALGNRKVTEKAAEKLNSELEKEND